MTAQKLGRYLDAIQYQIQMIQVLSNRPDIVDFPPDIEKAMQWAIGAATPIYVSPDISDALSDIMGEIDIALEIRPDDAPASNGFAYLGGDRWPLEADGFAIGQCRAIAWTVKSTHDRALVYFFGDEPNGTTSSAWRQVLDVLDIAFDTTFEEQRQLLHMVPLSERTTEHNRTEYALRVVEFTYIKALWAFMKQRIAVKTLGGFDRATRRNLPRAYRGEDFVSVIHLRALDYGTRKPPEGEHGSIGVRYIRRPHWHTYNCQGKGKKCIYDNQHYDERAELRMLDAIVCGPADAPLKNGTKLLAVVR